MGDEDFVFSFPLLRQGNHSQVWEVYSSSTHELFVAKFPNLIGMEQELWRGSLDRARQEISIFVEAQNRSFRFSNLAQIIAHGENQVHLIYHCFL